MPLVPSTHDETDKETEDEMDDETDDETDGESVVPSTHDETDDESVVSAFERHLISQAYAMRILRQEVRNQLRLQERARRERLGIATGEDLTEMDQYMELSFLSHPCPFPSSSERNQPLANRVLRAAAMKQEQWRSIVELSRGVTEPVLRLAIEADRANNPNRIPLSIVDLTEMEHSTNE
ncbi:MAG: hypothetical protein Q9212_002889 [Teloschistes hypoglaucus]